MAGNRDDEPVIGILQPLSGRIFRLYMRSECPKTHFLWKYTTSTGKSPRSHMENPAILHWQINSFYISPSLSFSRLRTFSSTSVLDPCVKANHKRKEYALWKLWLSAFHTRGTFFKQMNGKYARAAIEDFIPVEATSAQESVVWLLLTKDNQNCSVLVRCQLITRWP
jgi:hypothetical protein